MAAPASAIDQSALQAIQGVAGHDGMLSNADGELVVKPCTQAEIDFYEATLATHPDFVEFMPIFMGTLNLGSPDGVIAANELEAATDAVPKAQGKKIATSTAIVLENLEHGFHKPNVIDLKLGARLYAPGTADEKAARLDKVAAETTSGCLNFRIAGMKVWNPTTETYDIYDKLYGRTFDKETVQEGFKTYFESLLRLQDVAAQLILQMREETLAMSDVLEETESRFYSASVLLIYEGDPMTLIQRMTRPTGKAVLSPEPGEVGPQGEQEQDEEDDTEDDEDLSEEEDSVEPPTWRLKMIDFAHSQWSPGAGQDENVIVGLQNIANQLTLLIDSISEPAM